MSCVPVINLTSPRSLPLDYTHRNVCIWCLTRVQIDRICTDYVCQEAVRARWDQHGDQGTKVNGLGRTRGDGRQVPLRAHLVGRSSLCPRTLGPTPPIMIIIPCT